MSYILDALRRAQAERERGQVPGLHAQPGLGGMPRPRARATARVPGWVWALGGAALVLAVLVPAVLLTRGADRVAAAAAQAGPDGTPREAAPAPVAAPAVALRPETGPSGSAAVRPAAEAPSSLVVVSAAPAVPKVAAPATAAHPVNATPTRTRPLPAAAPPGPDGASTTPPPLAVPTPAAAPVAAPAVAGQAISNDAPVNTPANTSASPPANTSSLPPTLTAEQRREWPALAVGGSVWSNTPSARFVILGGQVVHEGQSSPEGVLVERITPKAVVLRWRDQRASLPF